MSTLAAIEMVARTLGAVALAVYLWDRRRRELLDVRARAVQARHGRALVVCAASAVRLMRRASALRERAVRSGEVQAAAGALTAALDVRRYRVPQERARQRVGFAPQQTGYERGM